MTWPWHRFVDYRAPYRRPLLGVLLTDDDDIGGNQEPPKDSPQACRLGEAIGNIALDHKKVEVAAVVCVATRARTEQDHLRWR
jgi:hypothetical protein